MRRRHRRLTSSPELDITAFLNLMIVLVPVLLLGMVFSQVRMIELNFPGMESGQAPEPEEFRLVVTLIPQGIEIADSDRGLIRVLPVGQEGQDFANLRQVLRQIKPVCRIKPTWCWKSDRTSITRRWSRPWIPSALIRPWLRPAWLRGSCFLMSL